MKNITILFLVFSLFGFGCRIQDKRELEVAVPGMKTEEDVGRIKGALADLKGVDLARSVFDAGSGKITVYYDSMVVAHKNIEINIAEAGYDANGIKAVK